MKVLLIAIGIIAFFWFVILRMSGICSREEEREAERGGEDGK